MKDSKLFFCLCIGLFMLLYANATVYGRDNYPQRIISLGPAITEELYILGVEAKLVGCSIYCQRPPEAKKKEKVSTAIELNIEKIVTLKPDLVLATSLTNPETKQKLKNLGIKVITFPEAKGFSQICKHFLKLGRIVGRQKEAKEIIGIAEERVDLVRKKVRDLQKPKVFIQVGAKPLVTVNRSSFVNDFIKFAGGINITQNSKNIRYSRERVLKDNPDIIIIVTMGISGEGEKRTWQKFKTLNAVKNNRIYIINPNKITSPTPLIFAGTLEEIAKILHPYMERER